MVLYDAKNPRNLPFSKEAFDVFIKSLDVMWKGMLGIFLTILAFYILIRILGLIWNKDR